MNDEWVNSYIGVPHLTNGRTREGWDCWGLILAVFQEQKNIVLPDWRVDTLPDNVVVPAVQAQQMTDFVEAGTERASRVLLPEPWSIAVVRRQRMAHHVGVVVGTAPWLLHCSQVSRGTACEPLHRFLEKYPATSFWRLSEFDGHA